MSHLLPINTDHRLVHRREGLQQPSSPIINMFEGQYQFQGLYLRLFKVVALFYGDVLLLLEELVLSDELFFLLFFGVYLDGEDLGEVLLQGLEFLGGDGEDGAVDGEADAADEF